MRNTSRQGWITWLFILASLACCTQSIATPTDSAFVTKAFGDLLNRPPTTIELSTYLTILSGSTRQTTALDIETLTTEFRGDEVNNYYSKLLNRSPLTGERTASVQSLVLGTPLEQLQATVAGSAEFFLDAGSTNDGFITGIFSDFLNRSPSPTDRSFYTSALTGGATRTQVVQTLLATNEYRDDLINSYTMAYLHRPETAPDSAFYLPQMQTGTQDEVIISEIIGTTEYLNNVPEPASFAVCGIGGTLLLFRRPRGIPR